MKISRSKLKEKIREVIVEDNNFKAFFQMCLNKAGKSIPDMSKEEKREFFNKIDAAWKGKGEKREVGESINEADVKAPRGFELIRHWPQLVSAKEIKINTGSIVKPKYEKAKVWQHQSTHVILSYGNNKTRRVDKTQGLSNVFIKENVNEDIKYSKDGYVKRMTNEAGKFVKEITIKGKKYRYNSTYKTYNSIQGNDILHKSHLD